MREVTAAERVAIARHPQRPNITDYIDALFTDFFEQRGDRACREDAAILGGVALFHGRPVTVIGTRKGKTLEENLRCNFGMPGPEGYRKALRLMKQAEKFRRPIFTFIDTSGAYPGLEAEERGQGEAIARNLFEMSRLTVPVIAVVTGEGNSGGALALAVADRVLMLENAVYAILSPEGFASILWKDAQRSGEAAGLMKLTAPELQALGVIDDIIPEPDGGAHTAPAQAIREVDRFAETITELNKALLPSGNALHISLSGGIAWYPDDGQDWETLKKYADFAMYQVKHADKGRVQEFDIGVYNREAYAERTRREFRQLLSNAQVFYCFQPIFSAQSGKVAAYEALMRSDLPTLRSPATIMKLAREQGALYEIERITFTKALETFDSLCRAGSVSGDAMLFVNSIASTCLTQADVDYIDSRWRELRRRMVVEITEEEEIDYEALERKRNAPGFSGMFALDDYGSGYSNENTLLQLAPRFVKVDITIIRGIDTSPDKQQILRNVAAYAHPRSMKIVAEGVETAAELRTVIELGADLLQGYFLARPAIVPGAIAPEAAAIIGKLQRRRKD